VSRPQGKRAVIADVPAVKLSELVGRFGIGLSRDARQCKALLADVCGNRFRGECAVLVAAVEEGVADELLSSSSGLPIEVLLDRLSDRLQANRGVSVDLARWSVECWAVALGVVAGGNTLATFKMDGLKALIDLAGADGTISDAALNRLLLEAKARGVSEADARAYLSNYAAGHGWRFGNPQPRTVLHRSLGWVAVTVIGLAVISIIAAVVTLTEKSQQLSQTPAASPVPTPPPNSRQQRQAESAPAVPATALPAPPASSVNLETLRDQAVSDPGALKALTDRANAGDVAAQYYMGTLYDPSLPGVHYSAKDGPTAVSWYRKAADQGYPIAQLRIGGMYLTGQVQPKDYTEALRWLRKAADQGNAAAQSFVGLLYVNGDGVRQDYAEAMSWFQKAADQGSAMAEFNIGLMYGNGEGVPKDYTQALGWFRKAADKGNADAQFNIGVLYMNGVGVAQDYAQAMRWYQKAAGQGNSEAQTNIGVMYRYGYGVTQDYAEAMRWYRKAADQGNATAQYNIGTIYARGLGVAQDPAEAMRWFQKAADQGETAAQTDIGVMYFNGQGVLKDDAQAFRWFRKAADRGDVRAQYAVGLCYASGSGVAADPEEARIWMQRAAEGGDDRAKEWLTTRFSTTAPSASSPAPPASAYEQGLAERASWERWFGGLGSGDFQRGAYWWSGQRNNLRGSCNGVESAGNNQFINGCNAAKAFFGREYQYRQLPTDNPNRVQYLAGWNAETAPAGETQQNTASPPVSPSPAPPASAYEQGLADRAAWEGWYGSLNSADVQRGAYWWSGQRNNLRGPCNAVESAGNDRFIEGCNAAKAFFGREYQYRQLPTDNPDRVQYLAGWNTEAGNAQQNTDTTSADQLNSQELKRLRER
jgi:TPR repeat protein